jgi:hypothetical protein
MIAIRLSVSSCFCVSPKPTVGWIRSANKERTKTRQWFKLVKDSNANLQ